MEEVTAEQIEPGADEAPPRTPSRPAGGAGCRRWVWLMLLLLLGGGMFLLFRRNEMAQTATAARPAPSPGQWRNRACPTGSGAIPQG